MRPADVGARYGAEEFIVTLADTEMQGALVVAERIRAAVAGEAIPHAGGLSGEVSVSIGVAVAYPVSGELPATLIARADEALYDAKHAGLKSRQRGGTGWNAGRCLIGQGLGQHIILTAPPRRSGKRHSIAAAPSACTAAPSDTRVCVRPPQ
jgi:GGDEF domain-containing protein